MVSRSCKEARDWRRRQFSPPRVRCGGAPFPTPGAMRPRPPTGVTHPMKKLLTITALTIALSGSPLLLGAPEPGVHSSDAPARTEKPAKRIPFRGKISAVDSAAKTFTLEGKQKARIFHVTAETRLKKDSQPARFDALKVGETVGGQYCAGTGGTLEVVSMNIGAKAPKEKAVEKPDRKSKP